MSADDFQALKDDIEVNGQREPVIVFDGMVLDGWHRYQACIQLSITPTQTAFAPNDDPVAFVLSHNLHRRHLSASQRAAAVVACTAWAPAHRSKKVETISTLSTNDKMAKAAGTTVRTITDAKAAHKAGLGEVVKQGAMTANEAAKVARGAPVDPPRTAPPSRSKPDPEDIAYYGPSQEEIDAAAADAKADMETINKLMEADDKLAAAVAMNEQLRAELAVVKISRDGYMNRSNELIDRIKTLKRKLAKFEGANV